MQAEKEGLRKGNDQGNASQSKSKKVIPIANLEGTKAEAFTTACNSTLKIIPKKCEQPTSTQLNQTSSKVIKNTALAVTALLSSKNLGVGQAE